MAPATSLFFYQHQLMVLKLLIEKSLEIIGQHIDKQHIIPDADITVSKKRVIASFKLQIAYFVTII